MDETEVRKLVQARLKGCTVTEIEDFGDAFAVHFVNDEYYQTGKIESMAAGAGPFIYIKNTGEIFETGSGQQAEDYLRAYRECGDIYGILGKTLAITGFVNSGGSTRAILDLKAALGVGLSEARALLEKVAREGKAEVTLADEWEAENAVTRLAELGFRAERVWETSRQAK